MTLLIVYGWLALTTALAGLYDLIRPVLLVQEAKTGTKVEYKLVLYTAYLALFILLAPIVLLCYLVPHLGWTFRSTLAENLFPDPKP